MHKRNFALDSGACLNDDNYSVITFDAKAEGDDILLLLPEPSALDAVIGTSKWMVRQATREIEERGGESIEIVGPGDEPASSGTTTSLCGNHALEW